MLKTKNPKATTVNNMILRPRIAGRNRACKSAAKISQTASELSTFGSSQPTDEPVFRPATIKARPIAKPKLNNGKAAAIAARLSRSDCSRLGKAKPNRDGRLCLSRFAWTKYIKPATKPTLVAVAPANSSKP